VFVGGERAAALQLSCRRIGARETVLIESIQLLTFRNSQSIYLPLRPLG